MNGIRRLSHFIANNSCICFDIFRSGGDCPMEENNFAIIEYDMKEQTLTGLASNSRCSLLRSKILSLMRAYPFSLILFCSALDTFRWASNLKRMMSRDHEEVLGGLSQKYPWSVEHLLTVILGRSPRSGPPSEGLFLRRPEHDKLSKIITRYPSFQLPLPPNVCLESKNISTFTP